MDKLPTELLPVVPHLKFLIFDWAIPDLIAWGIVIAAFFLATWLRLPKFFEGSNNKGV